MNHLRLGSLLALLMLVLWPAGAHASCSLNGSKENVVVTLPSTIVLDPNAAVGTVLATSSVATPSPSNSSVTCNGFYTQIGVMNLVGSQPAGSSTIYPTGVDGVGYRILHPDSGYYLPPWGYDYISSGTYTLSVGSAVQLVKTDVIASGSTLPAATLGYWRYDHSGSNDVRAEDFILGNPVTFVSPSCSVSTPNISVTLPTVSNTALASAGATAGSTAFSIRLDCGNAAGRTLAIQFDTATAFAGGTGVIVPSGTAANVGVQLVNGSFAPVTFGTPAVVGTTPSGQYNLTYYARYYATGTPVKAGTLSATATFTLSYP